MMTRQHFQLIADVIRARRAGYADTGEGLDELRGLALEFVVALAKTNPGFNKARFLKACGVES